MASWDFTDVAADHTLSASFAINMTYTVNAIVSGGHGTVDPPTQSIATGGTANIAIYTETHYRIASITDNGAPVAIANPYVISNVNADHAVVVTFEIITHTITASAGPNGSISPSGAVTVNDGENQTFNITPAIGYAIDEVLVDGISAGPVNSYEFTNVMEDHVISATFVPASFTVTASVAGGNGTVAPPTQPVGYGGTATIDIMPDEGYYVASITDNGVPVSIDNPYVINNVIADHNVVVAFALGAYNVTANVSGGHGNVIPPSQTVPYNGSASITIEADNHYHIASITDNGVPVAIANPYVISNVKEDHDVVVIFAIDTLTVTATVSGGHGTATPATQTVDYGDNATVNIIPDSHYHIASVTDNGTPVSIANPYVITGVSVNHDVVVTFAIDTYPVTATVSGGNGSATPASQNVDYNGTASIIIAPNAGYQIASITDNGTPVPITAPYVINNIAAAHAVVVTFSKIQVRVDVTIAAGQGTVSPDTETVDWGSTVTIDFTPGLGYQIGSITDNGVAVPISDPYVITNLTGDHQVVVTFVEIAFYFAEGYTGENFQEYLCLGQPGDAPLPVRVTYLFNDAAPMDKTYTVPAHSRLTVDVNAEVGPDREVSIKCAADYPFVSERPMYFDYKAKWTGGHDSVGATRPSNTWYFAEGYTGPGFEQWICVLNDTDAPAVATFYFQTQEAGQIVKDGLEIPARSRRTFDINQLLGPDYQLSLRIESTQPVVAERPEYFNYQGTIGWNWTGGHCVMGASAISNDYYLAEGTTREGFEEWVTIQNPNDFDISVSAAYQLGTGEVVEHKHDIGAGRRFTVFVPDVVGYGQDVSVRLTSDYGFLAERPMYFHYVGMGGWDWTGGHCVVASPRAARCWFLAEGYTGYGFEEWLTIQNPGDHAANVSITYYPEGTGAPYEKKHQVAAHSRYTVMVNFDAGEDKAVSAKLSSDQPIIVERPMYFNFRDAWDGGHCVMGFIFEAN